MRREVETRLELALWGWWEAGAECAEAHSVLVAARYELACAEAAVERARERLAALRGVARARSKAYWKLIEEARR